MYVIEDYFQHLTFGELQLDHSNGLVLSVESCLTWATACFIQASQNIGNNELGKLPIQVSKVSAADDGNSHLIVAAAMKLHTAQATPKQETPRKRPSEPPVAEMMAAASISLPVPQTGS